MHLVARLQTGKHGIDDALEVRQLPGRAKIIGQAVLNFA